jgi:hypothetical protein
MQTGQQAGKPRPNRPFWPGNGRGDILDRISTAVRQAGTAVLLTGGGGMGKTRLALEITGQIEAAGIPCRVLTGARRADLTAAFNELASNEPAQLPGATGTRGLLVVDQAEACDAWILEWLILGAGQHSISVMVVGRVELVTMLVKSVPEPEQVCDAITLYVALEPLDARETGEFVTHCLTAEKSPVICGDDALRRIVAHSHGVPGAIDRLMMDALRLARLSRSVHLTATVIDMIADDEPLPPNEEFAPGDFTSRDFATPPQVEISSARAGVHPPSPQEPWPTSPARTFRWPAKLRAAPEASPLPPPQSAGVARSMQEILADLQEGPRIPLAQHEGDEDLELPRWRKTSSAVLFRPPAPPPRRILPWASGIALAAVTSVIALQSYLHAGAPVLNLTDQPHAIVGLPAGELITNPVAASADQAPVTAATPMMQVAMVESTTLNPPMSDAEVKPLAQEHVAQQAPEPSAHDRVAPPVEPEPMAEEPMAKVPMTTAAPEQAHNEPAAEALPSPEPSVPAAEALAPTDQEPPLVEPIPPEPSAKIPPEPEPEAPSAEALSPADPEPAPAEPPLPEPTAEAPPEQAPTATTTEATPPDEPEAPSAEVQPPEPVPPEPPASVAAPEPAPQEPSPELPSEQATPPEPEPVVAQPVQPPAPSSAPEPAAPKPPAIAEAVLLEKGDRLLALGDIASARLLYETAAARGSARGALLAGRTLDPGYLRMLGARGVTGDPTRAAAWYERAAKLGDESATALLEALGSR